MDIMKPLILFSFPPIPVRELQDQRECLSQSLATLIPPPRMESLRVGQEEVEELRYPGYH